MDQNSNIDLQKAQLTLNSVLDAITNDFIVVDVNNKINYVNLKAKTNLLSEVVKIGIDFSELLNAFCQMYKVEEQEKLFDLAKRAEPSTFISEKLKIHITKSIKKGYEVSTTPIYDANVGHLGRVWQFRDITIHENLDNMKSEFISVASHQLRTPLTSIRGYISMMLDGDYGPVTPELIEPLKYVERSGLEMSNLIDDLLNISRLEKNETENSISEFDFDDIIKELTEMFQNKIIQKNISLKYMPLRPNLKLNSDQNKVRECIKNILDNSIKYIPQNGQIVIVTTQISPEQIRIDIQDNGIGIPEDQQDRIFEKFFRAANVLTENFDGTGLGLYYVQQAISKLGGRVYFKSEVNVGTTFSIELPIIFKEV